MTSEIKEQYISLKCEEYEIPTEGVMTQTSSTMNLGGMIHEA